MSQINTSLVTTSDGSHTLKLEAVGECYHSINGALQESMHVFIDVGFSYINKSHLNIFEVGLGTGLNALLSMLEAEKSGQTVFYETVEAYPISVETATTLNYSEQLGIDNYKYFLPLHQCRWEEPITITPFFTLLKHKVAIQTFQPSPTLFDLVYFDAFAPETQPELWTIDVFSSIYQAMANNAVLVTYCSKGIVKQRLREVGFTVSRLQGAAGKRHMLRATKTIFNT